MGDYRSDTPLACDQRKMRHAPHATWSYNCRTMPSRMPIVLPLVAVLLVAGATAAPRKHTVVLGQWHTMKTPPHSGEAGKVRVRQLWIDEQLREYTAGPAHPITDRMFVIRRAYRVNDALPESKEGKPRWIWRLGGWISVSRFTGHVTELNLPVFEEETSEASWYRDYAAYCGASEDGGKAYLVIWRLGRRKPLLRKEFSGSGCPAPQWQRRPSRVTFAAGGEKNTFVVDPLGPGLADTDEPPISPAKKIPGRIESKGRPAGLRH